MSLLILTQGKYFLISTFSKFSGFIFLVIRKSYHKRNGYVLFEVHTRLQL